MPEGLIFVLAHFFCKFPIGEPKATRRFGGLISIAGTELCCQRLARR
jgi:hypothetical protein